MSVKHPDSMDKIKEYVERACDDTLTLSVQFFRSYSCPEGCAGCCPKFSLDYVEGERWEQFKLHYPDKVVYFKERIYNGVKVFSDMQKDNSSRWCWYLDKRKGRCTIHKANPFSCSFELIKFLKTKRTIFLTKKIFSRGWNFQTIDGGRGAKCLISESISLKTLEKDIFLLRELDEIGRKFKKRTLIPAILPYIITIRNTMGKNEIIYTKDILKIDQRKGLL